MKTISLEVELTYDPQMMHCGDDVPESKDWFFETILKGREGELILHSNAIGDSVGEITVKKIL